MTMTTTTFEQQNILVSVIVPVYNVLPYLDKCIKSLLTQTYSNLQIILIDDGSTDGSGEKCDSYALKDSRITVVHKENAGPSDARNSGLEIVQGTYLTFVDSDDEVLPQYIEKLLAFTIEEDLDLAISSYAKVAENAATHLFHYAKDIQSDSRAILNQEEAMLRMLYRQELSMYSHGKLYRSSLFESIRFPYGKLFEDVTTTWEIMKNVQRVGYLDNVLYLYRQREGSIVHEEFSTPKMEEVYTHKRIMKDVQEKNALYSAAVSKYFFCLLDLYSQTNPSHKKQRKYLKKGIKGYRYQVLINHNNDIFIRLMAFMSFFPLGLVSYIGKLYKKQQHNNCQE